MTDRARLELDARGHRPDPQLEEALRLHREDRAAYDQLPTAVKARAAVYADLKANFDRAVAAGVVTPDDPA